MTERRTVGGRRIPALFLGFALALALLPAVGAPAAAQDPVPSAVAEPSQLEVGYELPVFIEVFGTDTSFDQGVTEVAILDASETPVDATITGLGVADPLHLSFFLETSLSAGDYWIQITTGEEVVRAQLQVLGAGPCRTTDEPLAVQNTGLTNVGFETGDFTGWTIGRVADHVAVTGADAFTAPFEGEHMAVLGTPAGSSDVAQPLGPNEICQDFVVDEATEQFVYNIFTYDYTGFDEFNFDVRVVDPATGAVLASQQQGAWGTDTALKTTGWRTAVLDLSGRTGQTVRLTISAGGTADQLYPFWAYVDSCGDATPCPEPISAAADMGSPTGSTMVDPVTGEVTVAMPTGDVSDVTVTTDLAGTCEEIASAVLLYGGASYTFEPVSAGSTTYTGTIPAADILADPNQAVTIEVTCAAGPAVVVPIGQIVLYDPSGIVSDAETGEPVVGAEVTLYRVPGWLPDVTDAEGALVEARDCRTVDTREGEDWTAEPDAAIDLGEPVPAASLEISPNVNPFITNDIGYYGWDVAEGCWYVVVEAEGYETRVSPVVGVPPEVTDLDLQITQIDEEAPAWPAGAELTASDVTETSVALSWPAATDNRAVTAYRVYQDGTQVAEVSGDTTSTTVTGLSAETAYTFRVEAVDEAGNESADGPSTTVTTAAPPVEEACPEGAVDPATFTDRASIPEAHRFNVDCAAEHEIVTGFQDNTYRPTLDVRRDQMASFIARTLDAAGVELPAPATQRFTDVDPGPHDDNIHRLAAAGIVQGGPGGLPATSYGPAQAVRRDQMASFLIRAAEFATDQELGSQTAAFSDVQASNPHFANVNGAAEAGLAQGVGGGQYNPAASVRRDQMGSFVVRLLDALVTNAFTQG